MPALATMGSGRPPALRKCKRLACWGLADFEQPELPIGALQVRNRPADVRLADN